MPTNVRIHVAAGALLFVLVAVIALFWSFPKLLVYVLLAIVAALAYGALYLILAAWMDPKDKKQEQQQQQQAPAGSPAPRIDIDDTLPDVTVPDNKSTRKRPTRKKKTRTSTRKKKTAKKTE